eukprot:2776647-Prymnesium_polylepis.1
MAVGPAWRVAAEAEAAAAAVAVAAAKNLRRETSRRAPPDRNRRRTPQTPRMEPKQRLATAAGAEEQVAALSPEKGPGR